MIERWSGDRGAFRTLFARVGLVAASVGPSCRHALLRASCVALRVAFQVQRFSSLTHSSRILCRQQRYV